MSDATKSVTLLAIGEALAEKVLPLLTEWQATGLVKPYMLVGPDGKIGEHSPIGAAGESPTAALAALGTHDVAVYGIESSDANTPAIEGLVRALESATAGATEQQGRAFRAVQILCPPRRPPTSGLEWGHIGQPWTDSIVSSTDYRKDEYAVNLDDDSPETLALRSTFTMLACSGLLAGMERNPLPSAPQTALPSLRVVRAFGRIVCADPKLLPGLEAEIAAIRVNPMKLKNYVGGALADDDERLVRTLAEAFTRRADHGALALTAPPTTPVPELVLVDLRTTLRMLREFLKTFLTRGVLELADAAAEAAKEKALARANAYIFGEGSAYKLATTAQRERADVLREAAAAAQRLALAEASGGDPDSIAVDLPARPGVWREFRATVFALADGSASPSYLPQARFNDLPMIVCEPDLLAPLPAATMDSPRACDALARRTAAAEQPVKLGNDAANTSDASDAPPGHSDPSFSYAVADALAVNILTASEELKACLGALAKLVEPTPPLDPEQRRREAKKARGRKLRVAVAVIALLALVIAPPIAFIVGAIGIVIWLILQALTVAWAAVRLTLRFQRYLQRRFQREHALAIEGAALNDLNAAVEHYSAAALTLDTRYQELLGWSDLLGQFVHDPFTQPPAAATSSHPPHVPAPLAVNVADAAISAGRIEQLASQLAQTIFTKGWMTRLFDTSALDATKGLRSGGLRVLASGSGLDADFDVGARLGYLVALDQTLSHQDRSHGITNAVAGYIAGLASAQLFTEGVVERGSGAPAAAETFLSAIAPDQHPTPFDAAIFGQGGEPGLERGLHICRGLASNEAAETILAEENLAYRVAWRLDLGPLHGLRNLRGSDRNSVEASPADQPEPDI